MLEQEVTEKLVLQGLSEWAASEAHLPHGEDEATAKARLLAMTIGPTGQQIQIASDGLSLDRKLAIEKLLSAKFSSHSNITIYFRRSNPTQTSPAPVPVKGRSNPFGVKFERRAIPGVSQVTVVASGKGGVGKSTVAVNLAVGLSAKGLRVGLLDADVYGPSAPLMLGLKGGLEITSDDRLVPREAFGVKTVSFGFLADVEQPVIWRGPLVTKALKQLCFDVAWGELDHLIVDLPPGTGDVQLTLIENLPIHAALLVTTPQDVALIDAHKALSMFEKLDVPVLGLIENMAHFCCPQCGYEEAIFGHEGAQKMALQRTIPLLAKIPLVSKVREYSDAGTPAVLSKVSKVADPFWAIVDEVLKKN